jgi:hypothetical protein
MTRERESDLDDRPAARTRVVDAVAARTEREDMFLVDITPEVTTLWGVLTSTAMVVEQVS